MEEEAGRGQQSQSFTVQNGSQLRKQEQNGTDASEQKTRELEENEEKTKTSTGKNCLYHLSSAIRQRTAVFHFQDNSKNLEPSYKMEVDTVELPRTVNTQQQPPPYNSQFSKVQFYYIYDLSIAVTFLQQPLLCYFREVLLYLELFWKRKKNI